MHLHLAAQLLVLLHFSFIVFVLTGGLIALRWPRVIWLHLPAVIWGIYVEWSGRICPLTPLENQLRRAAGNQGYSGGFIEHYLLSLIYPAGLTPNIQWILGGVVLLVNICLYGYLYWRRQHRPRKRSPA